MVKRDILTVNPPHQGGGGEDKKSISFEEPCDQKRFPHRKVSSSRGRDSQEQ